MGHIKRSTCTESSRVSWLLAGLLLAWLLLACNEGVQGEGADAYAEQRMPAAGAAGDGAAGGGSGGGGSGSSPAPMLDASMGLPMGGTNAGAGSTAEPDSGVSAMAGMTGGAAGMQAAGVGGTDAGEAPEPCAKGTVTGNQVVFIGDSFLAAPTSNIAFELERLMQESGSTAYSPTPRFRQLVGTTMQQIVGQYDTEHMLNPDIKVVIANGGGNDVLVTDRTCLMQAPPGNTGCAATIESALGFAAELMAKAEADGVEHLVYSFYPHEPTSGLFQGTAPTINESLDYTEPMARALCESSPICTFVSLSEAAGDSPGSGYVERGYINPNDVHPSPAGSTFFAEAIWNAMVEHCIAQ